MPCNLFGYRGKASLYYDDYHIPMGQEKCTNRIAEFSFDSLLPLPPVHLPTLQPQVRHIRACRHIDGYKLLVLN